MTRPFFVIPSEPKVTRDQREAIFWRSLTRRFAPTSPDRERVLSEVLAQIAGVLKIFREQHGAAAGAHRRVMAYEQVLDSVWHHLVGPHPAN